jgi:hypothetical protein
MKAESHHWLWHTLPFIIVAICIVLAAIELILRNPTQQSLKHCGCLKHRCHVLGLHTKIHA